MATLDELRSERIKKLNSLKEKGINPYPTKTNKEFTLAEVASDFAKLSKRKKPIAIAGRIMAIRSFGGSIFADLYDGTATFQVYLKKDEIGDELFSLFAQTIDIGDFIEASGSLFVTKKEEKSLLASNWNILSKSLRPLPEKWHGLQDVEERFRRRYLDTLMNPEAKERFIVRSQIIQLVRAFYIDEGFLEVDPPILQALAGGATAEPFKTHHNALQTDFYLTIAQELYLKELIIETALYKNITEEIKSLAGIGNNFQKLSLIVNLTTLNESKYKSIYQNKTSVKSILDQIALLTETIPKSNLHVQMIKMKEVEEEIESYFTHFEKLGINVILQKYNTFAGLMPEKRVSDLTPIKRDFCWHLARDLYINSDANVSICRQDPDDHIGNLKDDTIFTIWEKGMQSFSESIKGNHSKTNAPCLSCDEWYTFNA
jgi:lysyl-tRNA synthetase class II